MVFASPALQLNLKVRNTFLDVEGQDDKTPLNIPRRRCNSVPIKPRAPTDEEEQETSPTSSPRGKFVELAGPVKPCSMRFLRTMSDGSLEAVSEVLENCLSPDANLHIDFCNNDYCSEIASFKGANDVMTFPAKLREAFPDLTYSLEDVVNERRQGVDAIAIARVTCTGTQKYPLLPMIPSGKKVSFNLHMETLEKLNGRALRLRWSFHPKNPVLEMMKEICFQVPTSDRILALEDAQDAAEATEVANIPTVATCAQPLVMYVQPVIAWPSGPPGQMSSVPVSVPMQASSSTFPQPVPDHQALWQDAKRAELAAAALRAQMRLEAMEQGPAKGPGKGTSNRQGDLRQNKQPVDASSENTTTLMLRNIPNDFTREMLLNMLNSKGFAGKYDFVYLPVDFARAANLGYAFVNALTHDDALEMQRSLEGFCSWNIRSPKKCHVVWSSTQGISQHIKNYRNSPVMHESVAEECKPLLFRHGERVAFPPPTQKLKAPSTGKSCR